jgi:hypothetical protein
MITDHRPRVIGYWHRLLVIGYRLQATGYWLLAVPPASSLPCSLAPSLPASPTPLPPPTAEARCETVKPATNKE